MVIIWKVITVVLLYFPLTDAFHPTVAPSTKHPLTSMVTPSLCAINKHEDGMETILNRRSFVGTLSLVSFVSIAPQTSSAGIDVSGLRVESQSQGNSAIAQQLKAYDGSGASRVQEIKQQAAPAASASSSVVKKTADLVDRNAATNAMRYTEPRISKVGLAGLKSRYEGQIVGLEGSSRSLFVSFEFPSDWLQLDKFLGGVQYVDQRNGDKLYLLRASLPDGETLETVPKQWFGDVIFSPNGSIVKQVGNEVDEYKVSKSQVTTVSGGAPHRRVLLKFFAVTGNGLRVERRGLADAYQVDNDVYMLVTSSNANKFEAKGAERDTVEAIVDSYRLERQ